MDVSVEFFMYKNSYNNFSAHEVYPSQNTSRSMSTADSPPNPWRSLQRSPDSPAGFKGAEGWGLREGEGLAEGKRGLGRGEGR